MTGRRLATYRAVQGEILRRIRSRQWTPGERIPGEVELAAEFGCARGTVNRALRELADAGVVERKRRAGTRVSTDPGGRLQVEIPIVRRQVESRGAAYRYTLLSREVEPAPEALRARLSFDDAIELLHLRCLHFADEQPYQYEDRWIDPAVVPQALTADFATVGPNEWLVREVPYSEAEVQLRAAAADSTQAELLATAVGAPLFVLDRTTWLDAEVVTRVQLTHGPGFRMTLRL